MSFVPPFCPNAACSEHHRTGEAQTDYPRWWLAHGSYRCAHSGEVLRLRCRLCRVSFSERTFSVHYATHRLIDLEALAGRINGGSGVRAVATGLCCSPKVVLNRISRLARQAIGTHSALRSRLPLGEDLVADGFESFVVSQYWPNNFQLLVGSRSQYLYSLDYAQLRRKGRMSETQRRRRDELEKRSSLSGGQIERSFGRIISEMGRIWLEPPIEGGAAGPPRPLVLFTDRHQSYRRVIAADGELSRLQDWRLFSHRRIDSKRARTYHNPLFAVNYFDREIRKDMACHVRETVQWSREVNNAMDRMWLYAVWHNCFKPRRVNGTDARTHAEHAGVSEAVLGKLKHDFFTRRYFFSRISLSSSQWMSWLRAWATPQRRCGASLAAYITA
jgi:hypothetical protein